MVPRGAGKYSTDYLHRATQWNQFVVLCNTRSVNGTQDTVLHRQSQNVAGVVIMALIVRCFGANYGSNVVSNSL